MRSDGGPRPSPDERTIAEHILRTAVRVVDAPLRRLPCSDSGRQRRNGNATRPAWPATRVRDVSLEAQLARRPEPLPRDIK